MSFNVLIVDDSNAMRAVIGKIISMSGFKMDQCLQAGNGKDALDILVHEWVDVIISDINMPEMNGLELLSRLKRDELYKEIPVIMISTEGSDERVKEAFSRGAQGFIKKPFLPEELRGILYDVIGVGHDGEYAEDKKDADDLDF
jgi:two-component system, chemotaxis family, chemotaxis protein CheY